MRYYIKKPTNADFKSGSYQDKIDGLVNDGAIHVTGNEFVPNLVCVVDNLGMFGSAAYAYSESEWMEFKRFDGRPKTWLVYPHAVKQSGYKL